MKRFLALCFLVFAFAAPAQAQQTKATITGEINTNFADNTIGAITPAMLRSTMQNIVNSYLDYNGGATFACSANQWVSSGALSAFACTQPAFSSLSGTPTTLAGYGITSPLPLAQGGTANALTASNGGIVYSDASKLQILAGTGTAGLCLVSGSSSAPTWSLCPGGTSSITVGVTTITSGTSGRVVFDNAGVFGEYTAAQLTAQINNATASLSGTVPAFPNNTTTFLRGDLTWAALPVTGVANPTGTIGLSVVNGALTTAIRSDGAPALSQAINPTWTAPHNWNIATTFASATAATLNDINVVASTSTIVGNTGSPITALSKVFFGTPTLTDSSAVTVTDAATVTIAGAPIAAGSVTITNPWSFLVQAGNVKLAGTANSVGTITSGTWNGSLIDLAHGGSNANLTASNGGIVYSDASKLQILAGTVTASQCLLSGSNAAPTWGSCSGAAAVSSVADSGAGTLTISPTTGSVTATIALGHSNTWTAAQNLTLSSNGTVSQTITNSNGGVSAYAFWSATNSTGTVNFGISGTANNDPVFGTGNAFVNALSTNLVISAGTATKAVIFALAGAEVGRWSGATSGELDLGVSATIAGALKMFGSSSGSTILKPTAAAGSTTATLQAATGTIALLDVADQTIAGGANVTSQSLSTGNISIDCGSRPLQFITNGGAFTITAPSSDGSCLLLVTNNASAGTITFTGFTATSPSGDAFTTTNTNKFMISIARVNGVSTWVNKALQ